jgi:hypothetical protein
MAIKISKPKLSSKIRAPKIGLTRTKTPKFRTVKFKLK